jgi:hypothetical protein
MIAHIAQSEREEGPVSEYDEEQDTDPGCACEACDKGQQRAGCERNAVAGRADEGSVNVSVTEMGSKVDADGREEAGAGGHGCPQPQRLGKDSHSHGGSYDQRQGGASPC